MNKIIHKYPLLFSIAIGVISGCLLMFLVIDFIAGWFSSALSLIIFDHIVELNKGN